MILFHGTNTFFPKFNDDFLGKNTSDIAIWSNSAHFFSDNREYATEYANYSVAQKGGDSIVLECKVYFDNPYECYEQDLDFADNGEDIRKMLIDDGYDAIIINTPKGKEYGIFNAENIKIIK